MNAADRLSCLLSYTTQDHVRKVDTIYNKLGPTTFKENVQYAYPHANLVRAHRYAHPYVM